MHRSSTVVASFAALALAACSPDAVVTPLKAPGSINRTVSAAGGTYIVLLADGATEQDFSARVTSLGGTVSSFHKGSGLAVVRDLSSEGAASLGASGVGTFAADFQVSVEQQAAPVQADASDVATDVIDSQANPALAGRFSFQWNMRLVEAPAAWAAGKLGKSTVTVAILDTGIDYDAPDLNGLVDLSRSKSFMNHFVGHADDTTTKADEYAPIVPSDDALNGILGRNVVNDLNGHGTNVATQISSKGVALAGITSKTTLIGVKVLGANGYGDFADIINGVLWAADKGADVANMSLGGGFPKSGNGIYVGAINRAFNYAKQKGMVVVVAAGNNGSDLQHNGNFNADYCDAPHVICVSSVGPRLATSDANEPAFYTNFGRSSVDIAAPGGNADAAHGYTPSRWPWTPAAPAPFSGNDIASWVWSYCAKQTLVIQKAADGVHGNIFLTSCTAGNRLTGEIGTSQASPHVAGLAALLIAEKGKGNPARIKQLIQQSAVLIDPAYGRGRMSVKKALGL